MLPTPPLDDDDDDDDLCPVEHQVDMVAQLNQPPYPLHSSVKDRLHPDYVAFYNKYILHAQQVHQLPVSVARGSRTVPPCHSKPLPVGGIRDVSISRRETVGPKVLVRCFTPPGTPPRSGWPLVLYYHGGGWVFGDIDTENTVCTHICVRARAVVITTDYRLAPEDPWPAAIHDAWEAFLWSTSSQPGGEDQLLDVDVDLNKVAITGASAGANIAAVIAQKAALRAAPGVSIRSQVLVVPVTDNTATPCSGSSPSWQAYEFTAHLPAKKMLWYRHHYLPNAADWSHREASPLLAPDDVFARLPPTYVIVAELDVLRHDGEEYARRLRANGVAARVTVMEGMPHPFLAMDAVLEAGRTAITNMCEELTRVFACGTRKVTRTAKHMKLADQVVLVTGSSRGLGLAIARAFHREGARVVVNYFHTSTDRIATLATEFGGASTTATGNDGRVLFVRADVTDAGEVQDLFRTAERHFQRPITTVVNNAMMGDFAFDGDARPRLPQLTWQRFDAQLQGFLRGALNTTQAALPGFETLGSGRIVNIGSNLFQNPVVPYHDYTAAKGALLAFTRTCAADLGPQGVNVNMVSGGLLRVTDASASTPQPVFDHITAVTPLRRVTTPDDVAGAVLFFASPWAAAVTGQQVVVDGGLVMN